MTSKKYTARKNGEFVFVITRFGKLANAGFWSEELQTSICVSGRSECANLLRKAREKNLEIEKETC